MTVTTNQPAATKAAGTTKQASRRRAPKAQDIEKVLASWGLSEKLVARDAEVYGVIKAHGPIGEAELAKRVKDLSAWSLRRLATATHRGETHGSPLVSVTGRGKDKTYQVTAK